MLWLYIALVWLLAIAVFLAGIAFGRAVEREDWLDRLRRDRSERRW